MQTFKRLFFVSFLLVVCAAAWLRTSPYWTLVEISQGVETKDVARVERVVALERFASSSTQAMGALVADGPPTQPALQQALAGVFDGAVRLHATAGVPRVDRVMD